MSEASRDTARVSRHLLGTASLVRVFGRGDDAVAAELRRILDDALTAHPCAMMDLSHAGNMDPAGLGTLVRARQVFRGRHGDLLLAAPSRFIRTVLHTMWLERAGGAAPGNHEHRIECWTRVRLGLHSGAGL